MITNPFKRRSVEVWAIKQIDARTLHLCGKGRLESRQTRSRRMEDLAKGRYEGEVRMDGTGVVLHSRRLDALVPLDQLELEDGIAHWQGRTWLVSHVPQRCWHFDGRLVAKPGGTVERPHLVSSEDVSRIHENVDTSRNPSGEAAFRKYDWLEEPEKDLATTIKEAQDRRKESKKVWREDGSWGRKDETSEK
jgi:hypothetical protein